MRKRIEFNQIKWQVSIIHEKSIFMRCHAVHVYDHAAIRVTQVKRELFNSLRDIIEAIMKPLHLMTYHL